MDDIPTPYQPGSHLNITVSEIHPITVVVEKAFTPFTSSDVLVVRSLAPLPNHPDLPLDTLMIMKIYDTRHLKSRTADHSHDDCILPVLSWSLNNELKAAAFRRCHADWEDIILNDLDCGSDGGTWLELLRYQFAHSSWTREVDAYLTLVNSPLSGSGVPKFYASGSLVLDEPRGFVSGVLLLEYVPHTTTLANLKDVNLLTPWHVRTLATTICRINDLGVTHEDMSYGNILVGPGRALIIDFGTSITRRQGGVDKFSDEEWSRIVNESQDERLVKRFLDRAFAKLSAQVSRPTDDL